VKQQFPCGGGPLPSIAVADALLDERRELTELWNQFALVRVWMVDRAAPALLGDGPVIIDTRSDGSTSVQLVR
jgi:hypothetical protein